MLGGYVAQGPYSINIAVFFACLVTIACLSFLFVRKTSSHEIWSKIRSTVFPLSVIGFLLIPLVSNSDAALALTEAGNLLYNAIFIIGCLTLMRKTYVDPRTIVAKGLLYKDVYKRQGPRSATFGRLRNFQHHRAPAQVAKLPNTTSSRPSAPVPLMASETRFAITHPMVRPGTAAGVSTASTQTASEMRN